MNRTILIFVLLSLSLLSVAQTTPPTMICLAKIQGSEANNWNLRSVVLRKLSMKIFEQRLNATAIVLDSDSDKRSAKEAKDKKCGLVVYSTIDRHTGEINSTMAPSPFQRGVVNPEATPGIYMLLYSLKFNNSKNDETTKDKVQVPIDPNYTAEDYDAQGRALVDGVVEKILATIPKK